LPGPEAWLWLKAFALCSWNGSLTQMPFLIYMTGGDGSYIGRAWLTRQRPSLEGRQKGTTGDTAEGSCCPRLWKLAFVPTFSNLYIHAMYLGSCEFLPCLFVVPFLETDEHWLYLLNRYLFYL
jgi:hypothetical protein